MPSTVAFVVQSTITGFVYGDTVPGSSVAAQRYRNSFATTYAGFISRQTAVQVATAQADAVQITSAGSSARGYLLIPDSTYNGVWNITASTAAVGVQFQGPSPAIVPTTTPMFVYTTAGRSFPLQVVAI